MSQPLDKAKAMTAIDALVEGRSEGFKAAVYKLCHQQKWANDEPGIMLAISTGQLRELVRQYPAEIEAVMERASRKLEGQWHHVQAKLSLQAIKASNTARQIDQRLVRGQLLLDGEMKKMELHLQAERAAMVQLMEQERAAVRQLLADERDAISKQAQDWAEQQKQVLEKKTTELIATGISSWQERTDEQVTKIVQAVRKKHYTESAAYACLFSAALMFTTWTSAWVSRGRLEDSSRWADFERWNQQELQACDAVDRATCNIHIRVPQ